MGDQLKTLGRSGGFTAVRYGVEGASTFASTLMTHNRFICMSGPRLRRLPCGKASPYRAYPFIPRGFGAVTDRLARSPLGRPA